ncbi:zinc metallopeptidase [bacterium]|nr:zinc metallopeptidase [bacterium]
MWPMFYDHVYLMVILAGMVISGAAALLVQGTFARFNRIRTARGLTGAQVARRILDRAGLHDVAVERVGGHLTDHYDPRSHVLRLSQSVYDSSSISALGVAAHEAGHALQQATGYAPLFLRNAVVPVAGLGTNIGITLVIVGAVLFGLETYLGTTLAYLGVALFGGFVFFTLITLPVEFDASRRAMVALRNDGFLSTVEADGARKVLTAAALTYVAGAIAHSAASSGRCIARG